MKTIARALLACAALAALAPTVEAGTFGPEVNITGSASLGGGFPEIAYYNGIAHVVFVGYTGGNQGDIYYTRSTSPSGNFSVPVNLTNNATPGAGNDHPQVTAGPNGVFVAWNSDNNSGAIYMRKSTDGGVSFGGTSTLAGAEGDGYYSRISGLITDAANRVHLIYYTNADTFGVSGQIHHRMTCDGTTWTTDTAITNKNIDGDVDNEEARIAVSGNALYATFRSSRNGNPQGGWPPYSIQMQSGSVSGCAATWNYPARRVAGGVPLSLASTYRPEVATDAGGNTHLAFWDLKHGANVAYRKGNLATGALSAQQQVSTFNADHLEPGGISSTAVNTFGGIQVPPALASNNSFAFLAYSQNAGVVATNFEYGPVYVRESADNGVTWGAEQAVAGTNQGAAPRIAYDNAAPNNVGIVWLDARSGGAQVYYRLYTATNPAYTANITNVITGYYQNILGRAPDAGGLNFWTSEANRVTGLGADVREVFFAMAMQFFNSPEYLARNTSDTQYLTDLYNTFFSRAPDGPGLAYWQGFLSGGMDRGAMLNNFLFSTEFSNTMTALFGVSNPRPEVNLTIDLYRGILGVLPDSGGFNYWLGQVRTAQCAGSTSVTNQVNTLAAAFINSAQYGNREAARPPALVQNMHVGDLYNAFLRRGGDLNGYNYWVNQLVSGAQTRPQVRNAYVNSPEFQNRVNAVIAAGCFG